jgi:sulfatase modifying factor 1
MCFMRSIVIGVTGLLFVLAMARLGYADTFGTGPNQFTIDFVTIGNPGNPADTTGNPVPAGAVSNVYRIGQHEISREMVEMANTAGRLGLTLSDMAFVTGGPRPNMPATSLSWNEAARFTNWLNVSRGFPAAYKFATHPGGPGYSANAHISLWVAGDAGFDASNLFRNSQARAKSLQSKSLARKLGVGREFALSPKSFRHRAEL